MKKFFACAAALSFALVACGDDSSAGPESVAGGESSSAEQNISSVADNPASSSDGGLGLSSSSEVPVGKIVASIGECYYGSTLTRPDKAYLLGNASDGYQIVIPDLHVDHEWHGAELPAVRSGDSLLVVKEGTLMSLNWTCVADHQFDISATDADVKYFKLYNQVFEVVPGPIPEREHKKDTIYVMDNSSSSEGVPSSSSWNFLPPSSSSRQSYNGHVPLKSITATCQEEDLTNDPVEPASPAAYLGISNSYAQIELFNVKLTYACDLESQATFWDSLKAENTVASVIGDTLFVNIKRFDEKGVEFKCGCTANVEFTFDEQYAGFGYTAFENNRPPLELGHKLINRPDPTYQKVEEADAQCTKDGPDDPMVDAALPPVAHMYVNGDSAQIVVERVMVTCGTEFESVEIEMRNSALYVTPHYDPSSMFADCLCSSKVSFNVKMVDVYKEATTLVFDDGTSINLGNKMRLIVE